MRIVLFAVAGLAAASPASAEIVSQSANTFHVRHEVNLVGSAEDAYRLLGDPSLWWHPDHTYSGDSANMRMDLRPGGSFIERVPEKDGWVEHMEIAQVMPGEMVVMTGGLGPLVFQGASGTMVWTVEEAGAGSKLTVDYQVSGFPQNNATQWAGPVDMVLGEQVRRLRQRAATGGRRDIP
ncbi:MAG: ATPase [Sphingomonas sp.]|nr:ATPase [Sphingomonas sp.]